MMLADTQFGMHANNRDFAQETANFEFTVAAVNRLKPAFVIILGDLVNKTGDAEQIREFQRIARKIASDIPVYLLPGNHDVGQTPSPETLAAYRKDFGRDYYSFRAGGVYGIALNSSLIYDPQNAASEYQDQLTWLKNELETAKTSGARHIVVFQHHPFFEKDAQEPDGYSNLPAERRKEFLNLFHKYGVRWVFAGHVHKNNIAKDGDLEMAATGPVSMPLGEDGSGIRLVEAASSGLQHRYFDFGKIPSRLTLTPASPFAIPAKSKVE